MRVRIFQSNFSSLSASLLLIFALPTLAWADFFKYSHYLQMEILPEIQLVQDAYRQNSNPTQSSIKAIRKLLSIKTNERNDSLIAQSTLYLSSLYIRGSQFQKAEKLLVGLQPKLQEIQEKKLQLIAFNQFAIINFSNKKYGASIVYYNLVLELSQQLNNQLVFAITQQALGEVQLTLADAPAALINFESAYLKLRDKNEVVLAADAGILYFALKTKLDERAPLDIDLMELIAFIRMAPDKQKRLQQFAEVSSIYRSLAVNNLSDEIKNEFRNIAVEAFQLSGKIKDGPREISTAAHLASLYEKDGRYAAALEILRKALRSDRAEENSSIVIPLYVQQGRLLKLTNHGEESIQAYRLALRLLKQMRLEKNSQVDTATDVMLFRVYDALIDLYFSQKYALADIATETAALSELRMLIEEKNYFYYKKLLNDDYADYERNKNAVAILSEKAAVIYPVVFNDRLEILLSLPSGLSRYSNNVGKPQLLEKIKSIRFAIEHPSKNYDFQKDTMVLYRWLIDPFKMKLLRQNVSSLIFVLGKTLAAIPPSVLFDNKGRRYLVEQYAITTSPGLMLTSTDVSRRKRNNLLYFGLTSHRDGFASPQLLKKEVDSITTVTTSLLHFDDDLRLGNVKKLIQSKNYNRVHLSVPLLVKPNFRKSIVALRDSDIPLATLSGQFRSRFQKKQQDRLDLVVLSNGSAPYRYPISDAGLAIISYYFGSRSAIVSLWPQPFDATPLFMSELYRNLNSMRVSPATAVRRAKMRLIANKEFQHPAYWARFQLFGSGL